MVCPNCGGQVSGNVCTVCGAVQKGRKKSTALVVVCIILGVVIAACAVAFFVIPTEKTDIGTAARNYVVAAYYTDKVVNDAASYKSYSAFKEDLDIAIASCDAVSGGGGFDLFAGAELPFVRTAYAADALEGLDTDADSGYSGGYTDDASESVSDFLDGMKEDAAIAKEALEALDKAIDEDSDEDDIEDALDDTKDELSDADNTSVVVGNMEISFEGIKTLGGINTAFIGADIVIDGDVLYLGADEMVMFDGNDLGSDVTVIDSEDGDGVVMDTGNMDVQIEGGGLLVITFDDIDEDPEAEVLTDATAFSDLISEDIGESLGYSADTTGSADSESGVYIDDVEWLIGTWKYEDATINPWVELDTMELSMAEFSVEMNKEPSEFLMYEGKAVEQYMIFRRDGTGILYYIIEDVGLFMPTGFWWRKDEPRNIQGNITVVSGFMAEYEFEWDDYLSGIMANFQNADYSDFEDMSNFSLWVGKNVYENVTATDLLYQYISGDEDSDVCVVYEKISDSTEFEYDN